MSALREDIVTDFLDYFENVRGKSPHTIRSYRSDLLGIFRYLGMDEPSPEKLTKKDVEKYVSYSRSRKLRATTINRHLDSLSSFYKYLILHREMDLKSPVMREYYQKDKGSSDERKFFTPEEIAPFYEYVSKKCDTVALMILMMGKQGLRMQETRLLKLEQINFQRNTIHVIESKGANRIIPLIKSVKETVLEKIGDRREGYLFRNRSGKHYSTNTSLWFKFRYWADRFGIEGSCHALRRMAGSELYEKTKDIILVQKFLGHAGVETTRLYINVDNGFSTMGEALDDIF